MNKLNPTRGHLLETFGLDLDLAHGVDSTLIDAGGRRYLDFLSQYGALPFGHNPTEIWNALNRQQNLLTPVMVQPLRASEAEKLAETLARITPHDLEIVTLANTGAEAVEASIKLARARSGRDNILSTHNGFHGKTMGALSATGKSLYQKDFGGPARGFEYIPFGDLNALESKLAESGNDIAAFIVEPIQGEAGVVCPAEDNYIDAVIRLCRKYGVLSIIDEIQTGLGRTGKLFACEDCSEAPDMLLLGKALGGGLMPISAVIVRPEVWDDRFGLLHSSTFANNNLACAAANATIDLLLKDDQAFIKQVAENGTHFSSRLQSLMMRYPGVVSSVRGSGYMRAIEFHKPFERGDSAAMAFCGLNGGFVGLLSSYLLNVEAVLTAPVFNDTSVMRLQPPLIADKSDIDRCVDALESVCDVLDRGDYRRLMQHLVSSKRTEQLKDKAPFLPQQGPARGLPEPTPGRFCFLIHYTEEEDVLRSDPSFAGFSEEERANWMEWVKRVGPGFAWPVKGGTSRAGASAEGMIMSVPLLPKDMMGKNRKAARHMIKASAGMAAEYGASRFGLGAFTSIVTSGGAAVTGEGVPVTSGNTLTTVSGVTALTRAARRVGMDPANAHIVVVGATGAIGRLASLMLSRQAKRLTLVGNGGNVQAHKFLDKVADEVVHALASEQPTHRCGGLSKTVRHLMSGKNADTVKGAAKEFEQACTRMGQGAPIQVTTDLRDALETADMVLVATSADVTFLDPTQLRPGTVVCDVARPANVAHADLSDNGVLVFDGGLVNPPFPVNLGPFQNLPDNLCWGCLGETMLLALEGETDDYSIGRDLSLTQADRMSEMARRHGFEPAEPQWYGTMLVDDDFKRVAKAYARRQKEEASNNAVEVSLAAH
ncbi:aminotransferase class III-fold pyridoxal phosphate-dependent enzyme [Sulfitobacter sp. F26169L]|uniref:aminotransferase class III-fold pyridoxal phosphate-dependent enzyme n=1 Tax=Sulfitobacter sp. F26169L TaxID=2996015 RepID=UPI002260B028|nr:aminotransferase class III-fold pyridoxal phosphate-dependent enzyme [Sulfitobacter sp. F26169L]MCX7567497.1 aminotransferase class III-fold pyridoxal phosphate-dependent enzyme [Sulfitobacter sp. F26169L]